MRAVLLLMALALGAAWPSTGRLSVAASGTFSELASGDVPALPGGIRSLAVSPTVEAGGPDGRSGSTPRRPSAVGVLEPELVIGPRELAAGAATARATDSAYLARAARQALTRAGLTSSPHTAPPSDRLV